MYLSEAIHQPLKSNHGKTLSGLFAEFDVKNQNDRIYPKEIYLSALDEILPKIESGSLLGECDHPNDYDEVRLSNVSHVIKECHVTGNQVFGTVEVLDTPSGKVIQALMEAGIPLGISSRGIGNTRESVDGTVVTSLKLITYDLVADPSFAGAVLTESAKASLNSKLDSIESELPLNESIGTNSVRSSIHRIRESIKTIPELTNGLYDTIGDISAELFLTKEKLKESEARYSSVIKNMTKLQESYNSLKESNTNIKSKLTNKLSESKELKESINSKDSRIKLLESEVLCLKKELAIEKKGMDKESILPLLEGLTTDVEIENKLSMLKQLGNKRHKRSTKEIENLTESLSVSGSKATNSRLSRLVSSV